MESGQRKLMTVEEALASKKHFILGLLSKYLESKGIKNQIDGRGKKELSKEEKEENLKFLPMLVNSFNENKILELSLDCGKNNALLIGESDVQREFCDKLRSDLSKYFVLDEKEIEVKAPKNAGTTTVKAIKITAIFKKMPKLTKIVLKDLQAAINIPIKNMETNFLLDTVYINLGILHYKGDVDNDDYGEGEERGQKRYYPPKGWKAKGLNVCGMFDDGNDSWLGFVDGDEWCISYYGSGQVNNPKYADYKNCKDLYNMDNKVGEGIYNTPRPDILEQEAPVFEANGKKYKLGFMLRINPTKIRSPIKNKDYWVVEGNTSELRPYRILYKEV